MVNISGSQIGLVGAVGLGILYKHSDSRTVAAGIALAAVGAVFAAAWYVAGTVQNAVAESQAFIEPTTKRVSSIALGMLAGAGTVAVAIWAFSTAVDRSLSSYN